MGNVGHLGELIVQRLDPSVYARTCFELATGRQAIIAKENLLRADRNLLGQERELYRHELDAWVVKNDSTFEVQVKNLTTQVTQQRSIGDSAATMSRKEDDSIRAQITILTPYNTSLRGRMTTLQAQETRLRQGSDGESARITVLYNNFATSTVGVERLNGALTTARVELATARADIARCPNLEEVQQLITDLDACNDNSNMRSDMSSSVCEQLADRIRFIAIGTVPMAVINAVAVSKMFRSD